MGSESVISGFYACDCFCELCSFADGMLGEEQSRFPGLFLHSLWMSDGIIVTEDLHRATEAEDLESSPILGLGRSLTTMEAVTRMLKIRAVFKIKPCSVYQWLFWTDLCVLSTLTIYLLK